MPLAFLASLCEPDSPGTGEVARSARRGAVAPQGRMRGAFAVAARKRVTMAGLPLISQWSGPLTAPQKGKPIQQKAAASREKKRRLCFGVHAPNISIIPLLLCVIQS